MGLRLIEPRDMRQTASTPITIGVDVGQKVNPTTICVVEGFKQERPHLKAEYRFEVRHLERLPINTAYPAVAERIAKVVATIEARPVPAFTSPPRLSLTVDVTGVGRPIFEMVRDALKGSRCRVIPATFTHGDRLNVVPGELRVGKAFLVSRLQALMQTQRVLLPANHPEADAMTKELLDYEIRVSDDANNRYGAFSTGAHDDLVTALGLAVLRDPPGVQAMSF